MRRTGGFRMRFALLLLKMLSGGTDQHFHPTRPRSGVPLSRALSLNTYGYGRWSSRRVKLDHDRSREVNESRASDPISRHWISSFHQSAWIAMGRLARRELCYIRSNAVTLLGTGGCCKIPCEGRHIFRHSFSYTYTMQHHCLIG
ncbi:hypothetical protein GGS21DRAFT_8135 [Xylaria nigripes]|nr:hypothetical protein GGS21DRAFT_8135 [Xylaria nigripes]